jgi:hypothetical protein
MSKAALTHVQSTAKVRDSGWQVATPGNREAIARR